VAHRVTSPHTNRFIQWHFLYVCGYFWFECVSQDELRAPKVRCKRCARAVKGGL
jgi:hypothetical protein